MVCSRCPRLHISVQFLEPTKLPLCLDGVGIAPQRFFHVAQRLSVVLLALVRFTAHEVQREHVFSDGSFELERMASKEQASSSVVPLPLAPTAALAAAQAQARAQAQAQSSLQILQSHPASSS